MTKEEAIKALGLMEHVESIVATYEPGEIGDDTTVRELKEACRIAVAALRTQQIHAGEHGQWLGEGDGYADGEIVYDVWECSQCSYVIDDGTDDPEMLPNYCPECGAKMNGQEVAQQAMLNRSRWERCDDCNHKECRTCIHVTESIDDEPCNDCFFASKYEPARYCATCGRPLTEAAWTDLERRMNGETV